MKRGLFAAVALASALASTSSMAETWDFALSGTEAVQTDPCAPGSFGTTPACTVTSPFTGQLEVTGPVLADGIYLGSGDFSVELSGAGFQSVDWSFVDVLIQNGGIDGVEFHTSIGSTIVFDGSSLQYVYSTSHYGIHILASVVPEPATWLLMLAGVGLMMSRRLGKSGAAAPRLAPAPR